MSGLGQYKGNDDMWISSVVDSFAREWQADTNFGNDNLLRMKGYSNQKERTFIKNPLGLNTLHLYCFYQETYGAPPPSWAIGVYAVLADWVESVITYNNQPGIAASPVTTTIIPYTSHVSKWVTFDVQGLTDFCLKYVYEHPGIPPYEAPDNFRGWSSFGSSKYGSYIPYFT